MANEIVNKSGVQPVPCDRYVITSSMVLKYLQDQLGFSVGSDFTRWVGVTPEQSYVRMRVVINPKDIMADSNSKDYVDRILESKGAGIQFKDTVINTLKPYTYPDNVGSSATDMRRSQDSQSSHILHRQISSESTSDLKESSMICFPILQRIRLMVQCQSLLFRVHHLIQFVGKLQLRERAITSLQRQTFQWIRSSTDSNL